MTPLSARLPHAVVALQGTRGVEITLRSHAISGRLLRYAVYLSLGLFLRVGGAVLPPLPVAPPETAVLLLPALDATADSINMQQPRQVVIRHRVQAEFISRHFKMLGESLAMKAAVLSPGIDLALGSARTPGNLDELARRTGADWVVNLVVQEVEGDIPEGGDFKARTRLLVQVWDARRHDWLVNESHAGLAAGQGSPVMVFMRSLDDATTASLAGLLEPYPKVVPIEREASLADYLAGQTQPVVGDPARSFSGLKSVE
jgi:hypothetical protein